eukprot:UN01218
MNFEKSPHCIAMDSIALHCTTLIYFHFQRIALHCTKIAVFKKLTFKTIQTARSQN